MPQHQPLLIATDKGNETTAAVAGDEPVMLASITGVPVCVCTERLLAVNALAELGSVDVVVSDDGLQHYAMPRVAEIAVFDAGYGVGNGFLLPAGPLREPLSRLEEVQLLAVQTTGAWPANVQLHSLPGLAACNAATVPTGCFALQLDKLVRMSDGEEVPLEYFAGQRVHALAGIGNPQRFFNSLEAAGMIVDAKPMPDHHAYASDDLRFEDGLPVLVTAKDAVKLQMPDMDMRNIYEASTKLRMDDDLQRGINTLIEQLLKNAGRGSQT